MFETSKKHHGIVYQDVCRDDVGIVAERLNKEHLTTRSESLDRDVKVT